MRNEKGQFIKGHKSVNVLGKGGYKKGNKPWNIGLEKPFTEEEIRSKPWLFNAERMKGNKINVGRVHSPESYKRQAEKMKGNTFGFQKGNKVNLGKHPIAWNKDKTAKIDSRIKAGENASHWIDGRTPENKRIRTSAEMNYWRKEVFVRDNFTCQKYGIRGGSLCSHHINNFADFPELRFIIENGITLSEKAHNDFYKIYGRKNNTREQLQEFLAS